MVVMTVMGLSPDVGLIVAARALGGCESCRSAIEIFCTGMRRAGGGTARFRDAADNPALFVTTDC
jgi:hypothetical protein